MHTTLSAHPFTIELPPGKYVVTVERGKEYLLLVRDIVVKDGPASEIWPTGTAVPKQDQQTSEAHPPNDEMGNRE